MFFRFLAVFLTLSGIALGVFWWWSSTTVERAVSEASVPTSFLPTATTQPAQVSTSAAVLGVTATEPDFTSDKLYSLINAYRRDQKLGILRAHVSLEQSAAAKLSDMQERKYWRHTDPQGRNSWYLFEQMGYRYAAAGENLSFGSTTAWQVFSAWQASPEHNAELLNPAYEDMGLAVDCTHYSTPHQESCAVVLHLGRLLL